MQCTVLCEQERGGIRELLSLRSLGRSWLLQHTYLHVYVPNPTAFHVDSAFWFLTADSTSYSSSSRGSNEDNQNHNHTLAYPDHAQSCIGCCYVSPAVPGSHTQ